jgi:radical SAM superfamily enzyme YgiQ (UPF0313 family)
MYRKPRAVADFFDIIVVGEGEEVTAEYCGLMREHKKRGFDRKIFLREVSAIKGVYVPSLYSVEYKSDGTIRSFTPREGAPEKITKRFVADFDSAATVTKPLVPYMGTIHDRCTLEIMRGCSNGLQVLPGGLHNASGAPQERREYNEDRQERDKYNWI